MKQTNNKNKNVLLWGEHINLRDFIIAILIQIVLLFIVLIMPFKSDLKLILGLLFIVLGFIINTIWIKPKRNLEIVEESNNDI